MTLYKEPGYDLTRDFAPVSTVANVPHVLVVNPALGVSSLNELLTLARSKPGQLNLASQGVGTVSHLEGEMLRHMAGVDFTHVPYKGSAPALLDLLGGRVQLMFDSVASTLPQIRAGKLTPIAVTAGKRVGVLPEVPTMSEAGLPGYQAESWLGIVVPVRTPKPILERLNRELVGLLGQTQTIQTLQDKGLEPQGSTPDRFAERIRAELTLWTKLVKASGATVE
jgi:tripartite-type tricarboxylate transporter receptor subunit TctC